ncbi:MAG TPA: hypothetical protein VMT28_07785 [Terriglobales bacterium]|jgi:hypothetical protein|nr:hypothetical protein [Terriglobales bacterium]
MKRTFLLSCAVLILVAWRGTHASPVLAQGMADWSQWGRTAQHNGSTPAIGQSPNTKLADITFDPFTSQEMAETFGDLLAHYQAPLVDGSNVFLEVKTGTYVSCDPPGSGQPFPCGPDAWDQQIWNERAFVWQGGALVQLWNFQSDWKPEPNAVHLGGWEPVFHAALGNGFVFVPGFAGSIYKLNESDGSLVVQYKPFAVDDPNTFVSGPLTVDRTGNVYYNIVALTSTNPWGRNVRGAWLVRVSPAGIVRKVSYATLVPGAPTTCDGSPCGAQRPGMNVAPAVSPDGKTVYTVSRAHFASNFGFVVAANSNLTPKWQTALHFLQGQGIEDYVSDASSSTPALTPDGSVLFGTTGDNDARGYLFKFDSTGQHVASYDFGWDSTPAVWAHDGTYSVVIKDNHYGGGPYYISQLNASLVREWRYLSPTNFEWCVNAPAVDSTGIVYANSEDGNVYVINQGGTLKGKIFLRRAVGAAYTPVAIGRDGKIYTENDGDMFVVGN